jgi:hypothetical protein
MFVAALYIIVITFWIPLTIFKVFLNENIEKIVNFSRTTFLFFETNWNLPLLWTGWILHHNGQ